MQEYQKNIERIKGCAAPVIEALNLDKLGEIKILENNQDTVYQWLDQSCGIDWVLKTKDEHILGIAARIQMTQPNYYHDPHNSFTIRYSMVSGRKTEFEKRNEAIEKGYFYPYYTLQAYVKAENPKEVLSAAIIRTENLYGFCKAFPFCLTENRRDNAFKVARWDDIKQRGFNLLRIGK